MNPRPKHPRPDDNQKKVITELREDGLVVINTSSLPGDPDHNGLDFLVGDPNDWAWLLVELKTSYLAPFTKNEIAFFKRCGLWPNPFTLQRGVPVTAEVTAGEIKRKLKAVQGWGRK